MRIRRKLNRLIYTVFVIAAATALSLNASAISLVYDDLPYTSADPLILENGVTYVSVRGLLDMRDSFGAIWNATSRIASFTGEELELIATVDESHIVANG